MKTYRMNKRNIGRIRKVKTANNEKAISYRGFYSKNQVKPITQSETLLTSTPDNFNSEHMCICDTGVWVSINEHKNMLNEKADSLLNSRMAHFCVNNDMSQLSQYIVIRK